MTYHVDDNLDYYYWYGKNTIEFRNTPNNKSFIFRYDLELVDVLY